ncbi:MAG: glycosyltransferase family 61 protein [Chitinophaga sp.]|uniref:glycosyltransferase family 61 protein n=1 Tax=Chitinophaga sp. TaxID=1869181 RepID=UPI0025BEFAF7|nr:glycosyltransferase family 61 protein [Chitinophaga sp.]MBV8253527.1 glycosyltransferase family 61 protein [Chitinophaga sp.]
MMVSRSSPKNLQEQDIHLFQAALTYEVQPPHTYTFHNINILKDHIFHPSKFTFLSVHSHIRSFSKTGQWKKLLWFLKPYQVLAQGIWITDEWSGEYFHWLTDALTRWTAVEGKTRVSLIILPERYQQIPYVQASLQLLNIKAYFYNTRKRLLVKELILPAHTAATGNYNEQIIQQLREKFIGKIHTTPHRKLYVSRKKAARRTIQNEIEVIALLEEQGYEIHCFEDYHFAEQVALMQQAKVLIGLHGAGLTNMLFMPAGGQILELRNEGDSHNNCFFSLASALQHQYYYLTNTGNTADTFNVEIIVNIKRLAETIALMESR